MSSDTAALGGTKVPLEEVPLPARQRDKTSVATDLASHVSTPQGYAAEAAVFHWPASLVPCRFWP